MPSHLHPRSRFTSSLFATTLFASFFVVALPHILPCPSPRPVAFTDDGATGMPCKDEKRRNGVEKRLGEGIARQSLGADQETVTDGRKIRRECPIPKPHVLVGDLLGLNPLLPTSSTASNGQTVPVSNTEGKRSKPP